MAPQPAYEGLGRTALSRGGDLTTQQLLYYPSASDFSCGAFLLQLTLGRKTHSLGTLKPHIDVLYIILLLGWEEVLSGFQNCDSGLGFLLCSVVFY